MYDIETVNEEIKRYNAFIKLLFMNKNVKEFVDYHEAYLRLQEAQRHYNSAESSASFARNKAQEAASDAMQKRADYINSDWLPSLKADRAKEAQTNYASSIQDAQNAADRLESASIELQNRQREFQSKKVPFDETEKSAFNVANGISKSLPQYAIGYYCLADFYAQTAIFYLDIWKEICSSVWDKEILNRYSYIIKNINDLKERITKYQNSLANAKEFETEEEVAQYGEFFDKIKNYGTEIDQKLADLITPIETSRTAEIERQKEINEQNAKAAAEKKKREAKITRIGVGIGAAIMAIFILIMILIN